VTFPVWGLGPERSLISLCVNHRVSLYSMARLSLRLMADFYNWARELWSCFYLPDLSPGTESLVRALFMPNVCGVDTSTNFNMLASSASTLALIGSLVAFLEGAFWDMLSFSHVKRRRTPHHHRDGSSLPSKIHKARLPLCRSPGPGRLRRRKLTLVLDLDETLVHTATNPTDPVLMHGGIHYPFDLRVDIRRDTAQHKSVFVWKRPYLDLFMSEVSKYCEVVIYTAGLKRYASPIIDLLDLNGVVKKRLYRDACGPRLDPLGSYTKDLRLASGTAFPERALIIDNSPSAYKMTCPDNAVPIKSFFGNVSQQVTHPHTIPTLNSILTTTTTTTIPASSIIIHVRWRHACETRLLCARHHHHT